ncbi:hypothetical protein M404DRAFT_32374 [Pisolithus tinctorius Marx 270]|uniref:Uncharacterized protein n=1 Tax=Pisolithus tinctorius Marx 270 TaxID=870435 RepID=A0A0C3NP94_PISTI|nr:hypothetical protein M404DRAFT_32374 [Pisolithus tinctorius Marx 270]
MAGATDTKLWDAVEDSQATREKEGKRQLDHLILRYMLNRLETLQTQKREYLNNEQAELGEQGHPGNGSDLKGWAVPQKREHLRNYCTNHNDLDISRESSSSSASPQKSERHVRETTEIQPQDDRGNSGQANKQVTTSGQRLG